MGTGRDGWHGVVAGWRSRRTRRVRAVTRSVEFCDACGQVCDASCRSEAHRRHIQTRLAMYGPRL